MGEIGIQLRLARDLAIGQLDEYLSKTSGAKRLRDKDVPIRFGGFHAAWGIVLEVNGETFEFIALARDAFPFEPPEIYFTDMSTFLRFPHVDNKGKLCLTNVAATFSPNLVTETFEFLIQEARKLIDDSLAGRNEQDFIQEFQSYWHNLPIFNQKKYWSMLRTTSPTRIVQYYTTSGFTLFGESEDEVKMWLKKYCGGVVSKGFYTKPAVLIWLNTPLSPKQYPKTAHDILTLARNATRDADVLLRASIPTEPGNLPLMLGFDSKTGPILTGAELYEPKGANPSTPMRQEISRNFGFRPGHVPNQLLLLRYFGNRKLAVTEVTRVDAAWCLNRGGSGCNSVLFGKKIAIVGCGSLGADLALMLAKSGVGRFILIDDDLLNWGNVARHLLGGEYAGQAKTSALANYLVKQMPWLKISVESCAVETLVYNRPEVLQECDLVISTTGDWTSDCIINAAKRTFESFPHVIFGWTEAYGIAGHALAVLRRGGCLSCGMSEFGVFDLRVTEWPEGRQPLLQTAGCNDLYQPYGITDVASTKAIIAELALDVLNRNVQESMLRTWIGDTTRLETCGGIVHSKWHAHVIPGKTDRKTFLQCWDVNPKCPLCN